jgi:hypothetical protein
MSGRASLSPETIRRRKRRALPSTPEQSIGKNLEQLPEADENFETLLENLVGLAERETIFTMTLERGRLLSALNQAGYAVYAFINVEHQIAPGATITTYIPVVPNFVYVFVGVNAITSLPWWLTSGLWIDNDVPALPVAAFTRSPDRLDINIEGITPIFRFLRYTTTNNHLINTANFLAVNNFAVMTKTVWKMMEEVYLKPIVDYIREKAEERTGRPFP